MNRYNLLDSLRGMAIVSMVIYHAVWDLYYIFSVNVPFFESELGTLWQQSILWSFVLLSGFCWSFSRKNLKRGTIVYLASWVVTGVTALFMRENLILFGVLSFIGSAMLLTIPLNKLFLKIDPLIGILASAVLFAVSFKAMTGEIGLGSLSVALDDGMYNGYFMAYLGFPFPSFQSSDYVPIIPWIFLYWTGYFLEKLFKRQEILKYLKGFKIEPFAFLGKHSLIIYMAHQPIVYGILHLCFNIG